MKNTAAPENLSIVATLRARHTFMTGAEVMEILCVSRNSLCLWVRDGRIPAMRIGKDYRFDPKDIADWLEIRRT